MRKNLFSRREVVAAAGLVAFGLAGCTANEASSRNSAGISGELSEASSARFSTSSSSAAAGANSSAGSAVESSGQTASGPEPEATPEPSAAERALASMALEQKVAQLFIVTPEELTGVSVATIAGSLTRDALAQIPVGGLCYFSQNIVGAQQTRDLLSGTDALCQAAGASIRPFLAVDEEGGPLVARIANSGLFNVQRFPNMAEIGASGDTSRAAEVGRVIGSYLHDIGFNVDFAPDADVLTNPNNQVIGARSFGSDPTLVSSMVAAEVGAMLATGTLPCVKHFPGHGDTAGDSHTGAVYTTRTQEEIEDCELQPFIAGINAGCPMVMVGHIETVNFAADGLPASLSENMMTGVLREQLGFDGVIVSDSFSMGAITQNFTLADAAVRFIQAGGDVILMPQDLRAAYDGLIAAADAGTITEDRINQSVMRVLTAKETAGLLS